MDKKELIAIFLSLLTGGLSVGLVALVLELLLSGPKKKLMERGLLGIVLAMALSYLVPIAARRIHAALTRPKRVKSSSPAR